mmetsp:Transcript_5338/g.13510  ORF Transcript_5338/g.13510 Transcript_5338/m.13510 type:complete len:304 (-) Transcript_5338:507-1418(-)
MLKEVVLQVGAKVGVHAGRHWRARDKLVDVAPPHARHQRLRPPQALRVPWRQVAAPPVLDAREDAVAQGRVAPRVPQLAGQSQRAAGRDDGFMDHELHGLGPVVGVAEAVHVRALLVDGGDVLRFVGRPAELPSLVRPAHPHGVDDAPAEGACAQLAHVGVRCIAHEVVQLVDVQPVGGVAHEVDQEGLRVVWQRLPANGGRRSCAHPGRKGLRQRVHVLQNGTHHRDAHVLVLKRRRSVAAGLRLLQRLPRHALKHVAEGAMAEVVAQPRQRDHRHVFVGDSDLGTAHPRSDVPQVHDRPVG